MSVNFLNDRYPQWNYRNPVPIYFFFLMKLMKYLKCATILQNPSSHQGASFSSITSNDDLIGHMASCISQNSINYGTVKTNWNFHLLKTAKFISYTCFLSIVGKQGGYAHHSYLGCGLMKTLLWCMLPELLSVTRKCSKPHFNLQTSMEHVTLTFPGQSKLYDHAWV